MKFYIPLNVLVIASIFIIFPGSDGNILVNGDFEQSKNGIIPDGWNGDNSIYSLSNESFSGSHSLKYSNRDPSVYKLCTQSLNIQPGMNYSAGVKIKTFNITGGDYGASFCIEWADEKGHWLGGAYPEGIKGTNNWTDVNSVVFIPPGARDISFCCYSRKGTTGTAWFDDAFVKPYKTGKMEVMLLHPLYRGLLFEGEYPGIVLSANLKNIGLNAQGFSVSSVLYDSTGKEFVKDKTTVTAAKTDYIIKLNPSGIHTGSYTLKVTLTDKNNSVIDSWSTSIREINRENAPAVYFDDNRTLIVNKKKVFPLGMYWGSITEPDLKIYAQSKFNFILPYDRPTADQMKLAEKYNMKVVYSVKDYYADSKYAPPQIKSSADETVVLKNTLQQFKDAPSLLAWYINDEFPPEYVDRLNAHYNLIAAEDPNHPVLSIIINPSQTDFYLNSTDVIGSDPYVVPNLPLFKVGEAAKTVAQLTEYSRPVWMVIQSHNTGNYREFIPNTQDYRTPTYNEMRSMSWQAITEGAEGLIYYSYFDLKRNPDVPFDIQWSNLKKITAEIDSFSDVLLSPDKPDTIQVRPIGENNTWFNWTTRNYGSRLYIFVVNNGQSEGRLEFSVPGKYKTVTRLNENPGVLALNNSKFIDTLGNEDVKIYKAE